MTEGHIPTPSDICSTCGRGLVHVIPSLDPAEDRTTPSTAAGRAHLQWLLAGDDVFPEDALNAVLAIEDEAEARALDDIAYAKDDQ